MKSRLQSNIEGFQMLEKIINTPNLMPTFPRFC